MHSQNNEEQFILEYFGDFVGTFLDLGSNDGITLSNTHALAQKGWGGVLVDASPKAFVRLNQTHGSNQQLQLLNYAIGPIDGDVVLSESGELLGKGDIGLVSSIKYEEIKRWENINMLFENVVVPMLTFNSLLKQMKYKTAQFVSIDIEGMEKEVVPQIDFSALGTQMAIIEWNGKDADFFDDIMLKHKLRVQHVNAENRIYTLWM